MKTIISSLALAVAVTAGSAAAAVVTQDRDNQSYNWLDGYNWSDRVAPHADAEYTSALTVRTSNTTGSNVSLFDPKLTIQTGGKLSLKGAASVTELHMAGGILSDGYTNRSAPVSLAGTVYVDAATSVTVDNGTTSMVISAALIGSNALTINTTNTTSTLTLSGNGTQFSGDWFINGNSKLIAGGTGSLGSGNISVASGASLNLNYDLSNSTGSLTLNGILVLDQALTFGEVTIAGQSLDAGRTYTYTELNTLFDANIAEGGSGSITIAAVPEPAAVSLLALGAVALLKRRR